MTALPDQTDKPAEYAAARIPCYWRIEHNQTGNTLSLFCYRLDPTTGTYASGGSYTGSMTIAEPFPLTIDLTALL